MVYNLCQNQNIDILYRENRKVPNDIHLKKKTRSNLSTKAAPYLLFCTKKHTTMTNQQEREIYNREYGKYTFSKDRKANARHLDQYKCRLRVCIRALLPIYYTCYFFLLGICQRSRKMDERGSNISYSVDHRA